MAHKVKDSRKILNCSTQNKRSRRVMGDITQAKGLTLELEQALSDSGSIDRAEQYKHVPPYSKHFVKKGQL